MRAPSDKRKPSSPKTKGKIIDAGKIIMAVEGGLAAAADRGRLRFVKDNSDIGKKRGRKSAQDLVCGLAKRMLQAGWLDTKERLAEHISSQLARHHQDEPQMTPEQVERVITPVWREYRPDHSRNPR